MAAVLKTAWRRVKTDMIEDIKHGAPVEEYELEADECVRWIEEEETNWDTSVAVSMNLQEAMSELSTDTTKCKTFEKFEALTRKLMLGTMTADELCEWRDIQRAALIDHCSAWARRVAEREVP
jgi:hypothetical protein